jgi:hypothetical protein
MLQLVTLAQLFGEHQVPVADVPEETLHFVDRARDPVRDDDPRDADAGDEERQHGDEDAEHVGLLAAEVLRPLLERHRVGLELLLLILEALVLLARALVEDGGELGVRSVHRIFHDVHVDDGGDLLALAHDLLSSLHRFLALLHRLPALRDDVPAHRPEQRSQRERQRNRRPHEVRRVLQLEVPIEQVVAEPPLMATGGVRICGGRYRHGLTP